MKFHFSPLALMQVKMLNVDKVSCLNDLDERRSKKYANGGNLFQDQKVLAFQRNDGQLFQIGDCTKIDMCCHLLRSFSP